MATVIPGNDITYTATQWLSSEGSIVERTPTADSTDVTPTGTDVSNQYGGAVGIGSVFEIFILNNSAFEIILTSDTGFTMKPGPTDYNCFKYNQKI